jgi:hypothetical protein
MEFMGHMLIPVSAGNRLFRCDLQMWLRACFCRMSCLQIF